MFYQGFQKTLVLKGNNTGLISIVFVPCKDLNMGPILKNRKSFCHVHVRNGNYLYIVIAEELLYVVL